LGQDVAARLIETGHKLIEALALPAPGKWLPWLRKYRKPARLIGSSLDTIDHALCRTADAARCWEVNPDTYNDRRLTRLIEKTQEAIARTYPPTETTLRRLQRITPDGLTLGLIQCEDCGTPLIAISIDADNTLRWPRAHEQRPRYAFACRLTLKLNGDAGVRTAYARRRL
jgi:hypothetical protein